MVTVDYRLTPEENTEDALAANDAGKLTAKQRQRLLKAINESEKSVSSLSTPPPEINGIINKFSFVLLIAVVILYNFFPVIAIILAFLCAIVIVLNALRSGSYNSELYKTYQRLQGDDYTIETCVDSVEFVVEISAVKGQYVDSHLIRTYDYSYSVSKALWEQLRSAGGYLKVNYLADPFVALISAKAIPIPEPPTDEKLATVIGLGADGELIYNDEDAPGMVDAGG